MTKLEILDIDTLIKLHEDKSLLKALERIADEGAVEITVSICSAYNLDFSQMSAERKEAYLRSTTDYLTFCKERGVRILHFRDMLTNLTETEQSLLEKFGVEADYEVPTLPNMGVPLDLIRQYLNQIKAHGIFLPGFYIPDLDVKGNKIQVANCIGCFSELDGCFPDGLSVMSTIASREVRIIKECVLSRTTNPLDIDDYIRKYGFSPEKLLLYSFRQGKLEQLS